MFSWFTWALVLPGVFAAQSIGVNYVCRAKVYESSNCRGNAILADNTLVGVQGQCVDLHGPVAEHYLSWRPLNFDPTTGLATAYMYYGPLCELGSEGVDPLEVTLSANVHCVNEIEAAAQAFFVLDTVKSYSIQCHFPVGGKLIGAPVALNDRDTWKCTLKTFYTETCKGNSQLVNINFVATRDQCVSVAKDSPTSEYFGSIYLLTSADFDDWSQAVLKRDVNMANMNMKNGDVYAFLWKETDCPFFPGQIVGLSTAGQCVITNTREFEIAKQFDLYNMTSYSLTCTAPKAAQLP